MGQTYNSTEPTSGSTIFGDLYQIIRNHIDACATLFVGASSPSSPEEGRPWYDSSNNVLKIYDGSAWNQCTVNTALETEVVNARGGCGSLDTRLDVSLNEDGTISGSSPAGAWWTSCTTPWIYYSTVQFKENGNKTSVWTVGRAVKLGGVSGNPQYSYVTRCTYSGGTTTVTLKDAVLDSSLTTPQFGQIDNNWHSKIPWTRAIASNSATSKDYASANQVLVADGSGGVTVATIILSSTNLDDSKRYGTI